MKSMLAQASQKRSVSALSVTIAHFFSFFLGSISVLLEDKRHACTDEVFSPENLSGDEKSANDLTGTACDISNKEQKSSSEKSSYTLTPTSLPRSFPQSFKGQLHLCTFNPWDSQQLELIDQTNQIINVLPDLLKPKSLLKTVIFNQ